LLSSLIVQLSAKPDLYFDILSDLYSKRDARSQLPNVDALTQCLKDMLELPGQPPIYIVVDALDECPNFFGAPSPRVLVLDLIEGLVVLHLPNPLFVYAPPVASRPISKGLLGPWYPNLFLFTTKPVKSRMLSTTSVLLSSPIEICQNGVLKIGNWLLTRSRGELTGCK